MRSKACGRARPCRAPITHLQRCAKHDNFEKYPDRDPTPGQRLGPSRACASRWWLYSISAIISRSVLEGADKLHDLLSEFSLPLGRQDLAGLPPSSP